MMTIESNAIATLTDGQTIELPSVNIINPGEWFGKRFAVLVSYGFSGDYYIVEASCESDALDELVESGKAPGLIIDADDLKDYQDESGEYRCSFAGDGTPYDTEWVHAIKSVDVIEFPVADEDIPTKAEIVSSVARSAFEERSPEQTAGYLRTVARTRRHKWTFRAYLRA